jgi:hypothetical protein
MPPAKVAQEVATPPRTPGSTVARAQNGASLEFSTNYQLP